MRRLMMELETNDDTSITLLASDAILRGSEGVQSFSFKRSLLLFPQRQGCDIEGVKISNHLHIRKDRWPA